MIDAESEIQRLRAALLRVARFSHAKDVSHHGVDFEDCDKQSCAEARADLEKNAPALEAAGKGTGD